MLNPLRIFLIPSLLLFLLLTPSLVLAEYELRYNQSWRSELYYYEEEDGSGNLIFEGERQFASYISYDWIRYIGFGIDVGTIKTGDRSRTTIYGDYYDLNMEATLVHFSGNLYIPITDWMSIDLFAGYGYRYTQAEIIKYESNGAITKYKFEEDGGHQMRGHMVRFFPFDGSFIGIGLLNESKLLDKTVKVTADAITPYIRKTKTLYVTIGYRFGMPAKAPTYSPPSGKSNYNNPCQLFKAC